jgi:SecDF, P1 head subdomain
VEQARHPARVPGVPRVVRQYCAFSPAASVFVALLSALGLVLISYRGNHFVDDMLGLVAGGGALGVALFKTPLDLTRAMVRQRMALVVGDMVYAAPIVWTEITGGSATVTLGPNHSDDDAKALANTIAEGSPALPKPGVRTFGRPQE